MITVEDLQAKFPSITQEDFDKYGFLCETYLNKITFKAYQRATLTEVQKDELVKAFNYCFGLMKSHETSASYRGIASESVNSQSVSYLNDGTGKELLTQSVTKTLYGIALTNGWCYRGVA